MKLYDVEVSDESYGSLASLSGEIDMSTVDAIQQKLEAGVNGRPGLLALDLRRVEFLDSSGLRMVIQLDRAQREAGGRLVVVQGPRRVARVFEITMMDKELEIVDDPAEISAP